MHSKYSFLLPHRHQDFAPCLPNAIFSIIYHSCTSYKPRCSLLQWPAECIKPTTFLYEGYDTNITYWATFALDVQKLTGSRLVPPSWSQYIVPWHQYTTTRTTSDRTSGRPQVLRPTFSLLAPANWSDSWAISSPLSLNHPDNNCLVLVKDSAIMSIATDYLLMLMMVIGTLDKWHSSPWVS
jgi:hypothetical protein